jgi:hypothetical protein
MSDDEGDVVVMRTCAGVDCIEMYGLEFDETTGESFCKDCLRKLREAEETNDFRVLLSPEDRKAIKLIFTTFEKDGHGYWSHEEYNHYLSATAGNRGEEVGPFEDDADMAAYIEDEYAVGCESVDVPAHVVGLPEGIVTISNVITLNVLDKIYGGYMYHGVNALRDDVDALEDEGAVNFEVLE